MLGEAQRINTIGVPWMTLQCGAVAIVSHATDDEERGAMHMPQRTSRWTLAAMHRLPDDGKKYELLHGELLVTPAPSPGHEGVAATLTELLVPYVKAHGLGQVRHP